VVNEEVHKLEGQLDFFERLMQLLAALAVMRSFSREITNMLELVDSRFCEVDAYVLNTRYGRKFRFVKGRYLALMPLLRRDSLAKLTRLDELWRSLVDTSFYDVEAPDQMFRSMENPARQWRLSRAVGDVATEFDIIPKVDLIRQVFMVMDCLMQVSWMSNDPRVVEQILKYLLKLCSRVGIISTVVVMSAALMQDKEFQKLCSHDELAVWLVFEGVVMTLMAKDEALSALAMSLRDEILNQRDIPQS
jgi:undecaprenyl pyrophosphate phosphatase UppP